MRKKKIEPKDKVKLKSISYSKTENLGNYDSEKITVYAEVKPGQHPDDVLKTLKGWVEDKLNETPKSQYSDYMAVDDKDWMDCGEPF